MILSQGGLFTEQGAAVSEATPSRNVMMAMNNVVARVITPSIISWSLARKAKRADSVRLRGMLVSLSTTLESMAKALE